MRMLWLVRSHDHSRYDLKMKKKLVKTEAFRFFKMLQNSKFTTSIYLVILTKIDGFTFLYVETQCKKFNFKQISQHTSATCVKLEICLTCLKKNLKF